LNHSTSIPSERPFTSLVIDDDEVDVELLRRALERVSDRRVVLLHYRDPDSALRALQEESVDVIFIDYQLGAETGLDAVKKIRGTGNTKPMILLSGMGTESMVSECLRAGADESLSKSDLTPENLRRSLQHAEGKYRLLQAKL
jgi:DNA-binding NarL/FixJ family response regulator